MDMVIPAISFPSAPSRLITTAVTPMATTETVLPP